MIYISDQIIQRICECGWNAYLCGGAVRDMFIGLKPQDYDIVTNATPTELERIFPDRKVNLVGANFLVTLIDNIEIATYRSDKNIGPDRFNCITKNCETLEEDLQRRDFTINAMALCPYTGELIDNYNGRADLENKVIKFVGNPSDRIYEDHLRMIRAARFTCLIEGQLESETKQAIIDNKHLIRKVSPERIRIELLKVMKYKTPSIFFDVLYQTGLLEIILPPFYDMYGHDGGKYHGETLDVHSKLAGNFLSPKNPLLRLAGYLHDIGKPKAYQISDGKDFVDHEKIGAEMVEGLLRLYKFSNQENHMIKNLVLCHMRTTKNLKNKGYRKLLKRFSEFDVNWKHWIMLKIADKTSNLLSSNYQMEHIKNVCLGIFQASHESKSGEFKVTDLTINGNDVMMLLNIKPGPKIGKILNCLLDIILEDPEINTKDNLMKLVRETEWDDNDNYYIK